MYRFAVLFGLFVVAVHSQRPPPSSSPGSENACKKVDTIEVTASQILGDNPGYYVLMPNTPRYTIIDNACLTYFPVPGSPDTLTLYEAFRWRNGSTTVYTFTIYTNGNGTIVWATPDRTFSNYVIGSTSCGTFVNYRCGNYGDNPAPFVYGIGKGCGGKGIGKLNASCQKEAKALVANAGLTPSEGYYVPPFNLPTACVVQQMCLPEGNPLYGKQGGSCQPYVESSAGNCA